MSSETIPAAGLPSTRTILLATMIAAVVAAVILVIAVLPAEYGIDPLRTGALLGLTSLAKAENADKTAPGRTAVPAAAGIYTAERATYKTDSEDLTLAPGDGVEIKYHLQKGASMVYSWKATANVQYEFHGEPDKKPNPDYFESYELNDKLGKSDSYGAFIAPTTGIHGWFFENKANKSVSIHLVTAGFYDSAKMYSDGPPRALTIQDAK